MAYTAVQWEKQDGVGVITMNQPANMNALTQVMADDLLAVLQQAESDPEVKVIVFTGTGRAFCAGGDISRMREGFDQVSALDYMDRMQTITKVWNSLKKPTIAAVNGAATGAGLSLVLLCDLSVVASNAKLGCAFINMGLAPDFAMAYYLPRMVGPQRAKELIYTGRIFMPDEACAMGLINRVVEPEQLMEEAMTLAKKLAKGATFGMRLAKRMLQISMETDFNTLLNVEGLIQSSAFVTEDSREAVGAFLDKRKPEFHGK